jgi:RNA polymerase sigma-70 factor (ECF subfamily)
MLNTRLAEILYKQYVNYVIAVVFRMTEDRMVAEDIVQEAFIKAFLNFEQLKVKEHFCHWVARIAVNTCHSYYRKQREVPIGDCFGEDEVAKDELEAVVERDQLAWLLSDQGEKDSEVISMYYLNGLSVAEMAQELDISKANVRMRLMRARRKLLAKLESVVNVEDG